MKKAFVITIDTESDNQWNSQHQQSTRNARFIPRFQELCEKYRLKPVYLVDYSMAQDAFLVEYLRDCLERDTCEVGMHLHAWDTPPRHKYDSCSYARPYLIEYPIPVMKDKVQRITDLLENQFQRTIVSHRAGRWATNDQYFDILSACGYKVDCSFTPGVNWSKSQGARNGGSDYSRVKSEAHYVGSDHVILEVPMTIRRMHVLYPPKTPIDALKESAKFILGRKQWLRPALSDNNEMLSILNHNKLDFAEFMLHSSEMMPGGSPYFQTDEDIEALYRKLDELFLSIGEKYEGKTLREYYESRKKHT